MYHCYVTPRASASCLEQHSKRRPQRSYWPCGRFPMGRRAALASVSSLEGLAAASKSQSILFYLKAFPSSPEGNSAVVRLHTCTLLRLVSCRALRDCGGATEGKAGKFPFFHFLGSSFCLICHLKRLSGFDHA